MSPAPPPPTSANFLACSSRPARNNRSGDHPPHPSHATFGLSPRPRGQSSITFLWNPHLTSSPSTPSATPRCPQLAVASTAPPAAVASAFAPHLLAERRPRPPPFQTRARPFHRRVCHRDRNRFHAALCFTTPCSSSFRCANIRLTSPRSSTTFATALPPSLLPPRGYPQSAPPRHRPLPRRFEAVRRRAALLSRPPSLRRCPLTPPLPPSALATPSSSLPPSVASAGVIRQGGAPARWFADPITTTPKQTPGKRGPHASTPICALNHSFDPFKWSI